MHEAGYSVRALLTCACSRSVRSHVPNLVGALEALCAGWASHCQKKETAKTTPIASAFKNCTYRRKKWLLNRMREQVRFPNF